MVRYAKPQSVDEALVLLGEGAWRILAGGTDFYPALGANPLAESVLDINGLSELRSVAETSTHYVIGARTSWTDIVRASLPPSFDALKQAAREVGSVQIQNTGTVAGNICNASPAADGVPALLVLDAEVELACSGGRRNEPLETFVRGNRRTGLAPGELMTAIRLPKTSIGGASSFSKLGARRYLVISIAMTAVRVELGEDGSLAEVAIAVGACSAVAQRLRALEDESRGKHPGALEPAERHFSGLTPIDDVRGSAEYRFAAAREIVSRALEAAVRSASKVRSVEGRAA